VSVLRAGVCTKSKTGRQIVPHQRDDLLRAARRDWAADPGLREKYRTFRPNVDGSPPLSPAAAAGAAHSATAAPPRTTPGSPAAPPDSTYVTSSAVDSPARQESGSWPPTPPNGHSQTTDPRRYLAESRLQRPPPGGPLHAPDSAHVRLLADSRASGRAATIPRKTQNQRPPRPRRRDLYQKFTQRPPRFGERALWALFRMTSCW
jgi:hypothetical protein